MDSCFVSMSRRETEDDWRMRSKEGNADGFGRRARMGEDRAGKVWVG